MSENSTIEWTHHTFNAWRGCSKVHAGCTNCYAETMDRRKLAGDGNGWGEVWQGAERYFPGDGYWAGPLSWARKAARARERHRVFCASRSDVLEVPAYPPNGMMGAGAAQVEVNDVRALLGRARERLWDTIRETWNVCGACGRFAHSREDLQRCGPASRYGLDWLLLTKRPENWALVPEDVRPLVWLGTSASDQPTVDEWGSRLLAAEGFRYRFLSLEPMVGPVDLSAVLPSPDGFAFHGEEDGPVHTRDGGGVDWVIVGGESGPRARPCDVEWIRGVVRQCREAGVPVFVKQLGADARESYGRLESTSMPLKDPKGGDWDEWPEDLRVRQFPGEAT